MSKVVGSCLCVRIVGLCMGIRRTDHFPTEAAEARFRSTKPHLPHSVNCKALLAKNVPPDHRVYTPDSSSVTQSMVFAPHAAAHDQAAVAFGPAGLPGSTGYVGYAGDVNGEEETSTIVLAMAQWAHRHVRDVAGASTTANDAVVGSSSSSNSGAAAASDHECAECGKSPVHLMRCSQCKAVYYCSKECQRQGWKAGHKALCKPCS